VADSDGAAPATRHPLARLSIFVRQVVAELRKVIWPTQRQLLNYTVVVLVFLLLIGAYISGLDFLFTELVLQVFGGGR